MHCGHSDQLQEQKSWIQGGGDRSPEKNGRHLPVYRGKTTNQLIEGEKSRPHFGHHHGSVCGLLVALFPYVRHCALLRILLPIEETDQLYYVVRLYQFRTKPDYLHDI